MLTQNWCLAVLTTDANALPRPFWTPPEQPQAVFGFTMKYYNPNHDDKLPQVIPSDKIGFYGVTEPFPERPVCELSRENIVLLALHPFSPRQARMKYEALGPEKFLNAASAVYQI